MLDSGRIGPLSPVANLLKTVSKVLFDSTNTRVDQTQTGKTPQIGDKTLPSLPDTAKVKDVGNPSFESLLPIKILESPLLMQSEWAWKRLIATVLDTVMSTQSSDNQPTNFQAGDLPQSQLQGFATALDDALPRVSSESIIRQQSPEQSAPGPYETAVKLLWSILTLPEGHGGDKSQVWHTELHGKLVQGPVVQFADLHHSQFHEHLSPTAQQWFIDDRLTASVQTDPYVRIGQGIFLPMANEEQPIQDAYRWKAKKQTKITSQGKLVHRIQFDFHVADNPVRCTVTSAKPTLFIHFDSDDAFLRKDLKQGASALSIPLQKAGWHVEQWTVSAFQDWTEES